MNDVLPKKSRVRLLKFYLITDKDAKKNSVTKELSRLDNSDGIKEGTYKEYTSSKSSEGTVMDLRMGSDSMTGKVKCETCGKFTCINGGIQGQFDCIGHYSHINLCVPQIWLLFSSELVRVLESVCPHCSKRVSKIPVRIEKQSRKLNFDEFEETNDDSPPPVEELEEPDDVMSETSEVEEEEEGSVAAEEELEEVDDVDSDESSVDSDESSVDIDPDELFGEIPEEIEEETLSPKTTQTNQKNKKEPKNSQWYMCNCFQANCNIRFKYYLKMQPDDRSRYMEVRVSGKTNQKLSEKFIIPNTKIYSILKRISKNDWKSIFLAQHRDFPKNEQIPYLPTDLMVMSLPVIPPISRPSKRMEDNKVPANLITRYYNQIVRRNNTLYEEINSKKKKKNELPQSSFVDPIIKLREHTGSLYNLDPGLTQVLQTFIVNHGNDLGIPVGENKTMAFFDAFRAERALSTAVSILIDKSAGVMNLTARLQGKTGLFRGNLIGKRVNFTGRSVITPNPKIDIDEVSIPYSFSRTETKPLNVTYWNIDKVRELVRNDQVRRIVDASTESGHEEVTWCSTEDTKEIRERNAIEKIKIGVTVHRYLQDGDYVIANRQPTLHGPSMQAHRIRIEKPVEKNVSYSFGNIIQKPPPAKDLKNTCMNGFSTQKDNLTIGLNLSVTRAYNADFDGDEINLHICQTVEAEPEMKYLMAVDKQLGCKFMGIVQDTLHGSFLMSSPDVFIEEELASYLYMQLNLKFPDIEFPKPCVLRPKKLWTGRQFLNLVFTDAKISHQLHVDCFGEEELADDLIMIRGNIINGQITKKHFGEGGYLMSTITTNFGFDVAKNIINKFQIIVNPWVLRYGISVGIKDCIPSTNVLEKINEIKKDTSEKLDDVSKQSELSISKFCQIFNNSIQKLIVDDAKKVGNRILKMTQSGSKGSISNLTQIQGCLPQQNVGGGRPFRDTKRVLPTDSSDNLQSKGFIMNSLVTGLNVREYFCHAAGGREGIIDTGIKTSKTGYSTRRISCVTEGAAVTYIGSVFNQSILKGVVTSLLYGCDGINAQKLIRHYITIHKNPIEKLNNLLEPFCDSMYYDTFLQQLIEDREKLIQVSLQRQKIDSLFLLPVDVEHIFQCNVSSTPNNNNCFDELYYKELFDYSQHSERFIPFRKKNTKYGKEMNKNATELFRIMLRQQFLKYHNYIPNKDIFYKILNQIEIDYEKSLAIPGEPVGLIATQSLMQAIMQATLNTVSLYYYLKTHFFTRIYSHIYSHVYIHTYIVPNSWYRFISCNIRWFKLF